MYPHFLSSWIVLFIGFLLAAPAQAQQSSVSPEQRWTQYQQSPSTETGRKAGRKALRQWAAAPDPERLRAAATTLSDEAAFWPDVVEALTEAYRTSTKPPSYREGYEALLKELKQRVKDSEGWLTVMIALGDYYWAVEQDRWSAINTYAEASERSGGAHRPGIQPLINTLEKRLRSLRRLDIGQSAPLFHVTTLADSTVSANKLRGDPVILYFWARWCLPCRRKFPDFNELQATYRDSDLHLLGLIFDVTDRDKLQAYLDEVTLTWPQAITADWSKESRPPQQLYGVRGLGGNGAGYTVLIDRRGRIAADGYGPDAIRDTLRAIVNQ